MNNNREKNHLLREVLSESDSFRSEVLEAALGAARRRRQRRQRIGSPGIFN